MKFNNALVWTSLWATISVDAWLSSTTSTTTNIPKNGRLSTIQSSSSSARVVFPSPLYAAASNQKDGDEDDDDAAADAAAKRKKQIEDDLIEVFKSVSPSGSSSNSNNAPKLGIDIGKMLDPLTEQEAAELKAAATEVINDAIAEGLDDIERLRVKMQAELDAKRKSMQLQSEMNTRRESEKLMRKIDALTDGFLSKTEMTRSQTKIASAADQAMSGKGLDMGAWGTLSGAVVLTESGGGGGGSSSLLGSVEAARQMNARAANNENEASTASAAPQQSNRIVIVADESQDEYAKKLIPALTDELQSILPGLQVSVYKPTATLPLGGDNAACVLFFLTSLADKSTVKNAADRLLRKTLLGGGAIAQPPTQIVAISTVGVERTNKMPYSMQNLLGGGKLDKRRQMEESIIKIVNDRAVTPALDYTICRLGELKDNGGGEQFALSAFDKLDGSTDLDTAVTVLTQAIAYQPAARNTTLSCVGKLPTTSDNMDAILEDAFLRIDGPEMLRIDLSEEPSRDFEPLVEYVQEWAFYLAETGKGLTTPIRAEVSSIASVPSGVNKQFGVQILFLPTNTGRNYLSREEEKGREKKGQSTKTPKLTSERQIKMAKEGGLEIFVEVTTNDTLRIRARRCNYGNDAVIKELSESTILSRLKQSIEVWKKDHQGKWG